jgi:hypothetical protein
LKHTKLLILIATIIILLGTVSASYYDDEISDFSQDSYLELPELDSQKDIGTKLVAPFLLIFLILKVGLERALRFTLDADKKHWFGNNPEYKKQRKKIGKQSTLMALIISAMIVPTPAFQIIRKWTTFVFGSVTMIFMAIILGGFLYLLAKNLGGSSRNIGE